MWSGQSEFFSDLWIFLQLDMTPLLALSASLEYLFYGWSTAIINILLFECGDPL